MSPDNQPPRAVTINQCAFCGSAKIVRGVKVDQLAEVETIGLAYHTRFLLDGTEQLYADVCDDCGSVVRMYVQTTGRKWITK